MEELKRYDIFFTYYPIKRLQFPARFSRSAWLSGNALAGNRNFLITSRKKDAYILIISAKKYVNDIE